MQIFTYAHKSLHFLPGSVPPYPVVVLLAGESFSWGSGSLHDGRALAAFARVVVVTFNYRIGVLGEIIYLFQIIILL